MPPEGGTANNPKRRRRFALPGHSKLAHTSRFDFLLEKLVLHRIETECFTDARKAAAMDRGRAQCFQAPAVFRRRITFVH